MAVSILKIKLHVLSLALSVGNSGPRIAEMVDTPMSVGPSRKVSSKVSSEQKSKKTKKAKKPPNVRSEFPETWLWTEEVVR